MAIPEHEVTVVLDGIAFGESPRWHDGKVWFSDWGAREVIAVNPDGTAPTVVARPPVAPACIDFLPDGRMLVVSGQTLYVRDGEQLRAHADLSPLSTFAWNDIATDNRGIAFVNCVGFEFPGGEFAPGSIAAVLPDGTARSVAGDVAFPNGMAVTPDDATLIVAESYGNCLTAFDIDDDGSLSRRRVWAALGPGVPPDGICIDADGAVWYADVPNRCCVRVREGASPGQVLDRVDFDRGAFSCTTDGANLYVTATEWGGAIASGDAARTGQLLRVRL